MNTLRLAICIASIIACTGCATIWAPPQEDMEARRLIKTVQNHNAHLIQYKALAKVYLDTNGTSLSGRVALAAVIPDRLRLEWLSAVGQPMTRLAGDGKQIAIDVPGENGIRRMPQSSDSLESLIQIPIGIEELQSLTSGRPMLPEFSAAQIISQDDRRVVIALKNRWHRLLAKIDVEPKKGRVMRMENFNRDEELVYAVNWKKWKLVGKYEIPNHVELTTQSGQKLEMSLARFWPNVDVPPSLFQLVSPVD